MLENVNQAGRNAHRQDLNTLSGWIGILFESATRMNDHWWWRILLASRRIISKLLMIRSLKVTPFDQSLKLMDHWEHLEIDMYKRSEKPQTSFDDLKKDRSDAEEILMQFNDQITRMRKSIWWRLGLFLRFTLGALKLKKRDFRMPTVDSDEVMKRYKKWIPALSTISSHSERQPIIDSMDPILSQHRDKIIEALDGKNDGVYETFILKLLEHHKNVSSMRAVLEANKRSVPDLLRQNIERTDEPLVSIIMATFNRAAIIEEAIDSIKEQTWQNWELLICDDGSEDNTGEIIAAQNDSRIRYFRFEHGGAAKARNSGLAHAKGAYVAYLDTDNLWHPAYLHIMIGRLIRHAGCYCAYAKFIDVEPAEDASENWQLKGYNGQEYNFERLHEKNYIDLNAFTHRKYINQILGGFTEDLPRLQDWDLALKYTYIRDPLYINTFLAICRRNKKWDQISTAKDIDHSAVIKRVRQNASNYFSQGLPYKDTHEQPGKITVISWDICRNHFSKAYNVAEALHQTGKYKVRLVGFRFFNTPIFEPYADVTPDFETFYFSGAKFPEFNNDFNYALEKAGDADIIYCIKPRFPSLGLALLANNRFGTPVALEVNDLETMIEQPIHTEQQEGVSLDDVDCSDPELLNPRSQIWSRIMENCAQKMPLIVTHNKNLDTRYGNRTFCLRNPKDEKYFNPDAYDRDSIRMELGIAPGEKVILFAGLLRRHKGIRYIVELIRTLGGPPYRALFVSSLPTSDQKDLEEKYKGEITILPPQGRNNIARINYASDAVILWLNPNNKPSHYQMPYKITDAFAMKVPVIANDISDLGDLGRQGYLRLVEYGNLEALKNTVLDIFKQPENHREMVEAGRRLYLRQFSYRSTQTNFSIIAQAAHQHHGVLPVAKEFAEFFTRFHRA